MKCLLLVYLCLFCVAYGQDDFFDKYGYTKIMQSCFGPSVYEEHLRILQAAQRDCNGQYFDLMRRVPGTYSTDDSYSGFGTSNRNPFDQNYRPNDFRDNFPVQEYFPTSGGFGTFNDQQYRPGVRPTIGPAIVTTTLRPPFSSTVGVFPQRHGERNYLVDETRIQEALTKVEGAMGNLTCVLQRLSVIDTNFNIIPQNIIRTLYDRVTDRSLRDDLVSGINFCRDMLQCLPEDKVGTALRYSLQRVAAFVKCEKKVRLNACVKNDMRRNINRFDLSALPDDGGRTGPLEKLMTILIGAETVDELELF